MCVNLRPADACERASLNLQATGEKKKENPSLVRMLNEGLKFKHQINVE